MAQANRDAALKCSATTLLTIYYVVVGLAIAEGLHRVFSDEGNFVGMGAFRGANLPKTFLLLALLPTICRFVHGASMHLGMSSDNRYKPLVDFAAFFVQASIFYLMALSLETLSSFSLLFGALLLFDTIWLIVLRSICYIKFGPTEKQWLVSNSTLIGILAMLYLWRNHITDTAGAFFILAVAFAATAWDYARNSKFYFPPPEPGGP